LYPVIRDKGLANIPYALENGGQSFYIDRRYQTPEEISRAMKFNRMDPMNTVKSPEDVLLSKPELLRSTSGRPLTWVNNELRNSHLLPEVKWKFDF